MNEFLKMDVFFFVTTLAVVLLATLGAVVLWRIAGILKNIEHLSEQVALEGDELRHDLAGVRADIKRGKGRLKSILGLFNKKATKRATKNPS